MALQVWLPLNGDLHNQGLSNITVTNHGATVNSAGKIGQCYYFDGTDDYIETTYSTAIGTNDFSIAMWLKIPTLTSGSYFTICSSKGGSAASSGFGIYWNYSQKKFLWSTADGSSATEIWMANTVDTIVYDKWIHLVMIRNNSDSKKGYFYIDGARYELTSVPAIRNITTDTKLFIGRCSTTTHYPTKMYLNDFRIYDHALSDKEVKKISKGLILHYPLNGESQILVPAGYQQLEYIESTGTQYINTNIIPQETFTYKFKYALMEFSGYKGPFGSYSTETANATRIIDKNGSSTDYYIYFNSKANTPVTISGLTTATGEIIEGYFSKYTYYLNNITKNIIKTAYNATDLYPTKGTAIVNPMWLFRYGSNYSKTKIYYFATYNENTCIQYLIPAKRLSDNTLGMYDIINRTFLVNVGTGTFTAGTIVKILNTIYDISGYNHNGTATGNIINEINPYKNSHSYNLTDSASAIAIGNLSTIVPEGNFTFNIWFKKITGEWSSKSWETILGGPSGFELEGKMQSTQQAYIHPYSWGGGSTSNPNNYSIQYSLDEWHMLTMVRTTSNSKFYLDGKLKVTGSAGSIPSGSYFIGAWQTAAKQNYRGQLSDASIYATALSADDVLELYKQSKIINNGNILPRSLD